MNVCMSFENGTVWKNWKELTLMNQTNRNNNVCFVI